MKLACALCHFTEKSFDPCRGNLETIHISIILSIAPLLCHSGMGTITPSHKLRTPENNAAILEEAVTGSYGFDITSQIFGCEIMRERFNIPTVALSIHDILQ